MTTATTEIPGRVVINDVRWDTYERLLEDFEHHHIRLTYDRGKLEIMSPTKRHERFKRLMAKFVDGISRGFQMPVYSLGSATLKEVELARGIEADDWFYIQSEPLVRGKDEIDLEHDPPPDLGIEIDITSTVDDRLPVYWELGVPEIWVWRADAVRFLHRRPRGKYVEARKSKAFPFLTPAILMRFLEQRNEMDETSLVDALVEYLKSQTRKKA
jgi:Uma2 family endonuclease